MNIFCSYSPQAVECIRNISSGPFVAGPLVLRTFLLRTFRCRTFRGRTFRPRTFRPRTFWGRTFCRCTVRTTDKQKGQHVKNFLTRKTAYKSGSGSRLFAESGTVSRPRFLRQKKLKYFFMPFGLPRRTCMFPKNPSGLRVENWWTTFQPLQSLADFEPLIEVPLYYRCIRYQLCRYQTHMYHRGQIHSDIAQNHHPMTKLRKSRRLAYSP